VADEIRTILVVFYTIREFLAISTTRYIESNDGP